MSSMPLGHRFCEPSRFPANNASMSMVSLLPWLPGRIVVLLSHNDCRNGLQLCNGLLASAEQFSRCAETTQPPLLAIARHLRASRSNGLIHSVDPRLDTRAS